MQVTLKKTGAGIMVAAFVLAFVLGAGARSGSRRWYLSIDSGLLGGALGAMIGLSGVVVEEIQGMRRDRRMRKSSVQDGSEPREER